MYWHPSPKSSALLPDKPEYGSPKSLKDNSTLCCSASIKVSHNA